jgi:hypothetical protein
MTTTMIQGPRYRVTKRSKRGEFRVGDLVQLLNDGGIASPAVGGWIDVEDVPAATKGWAIELDRVWLATRRASLEADIAQIAQWEAMA